LATTSADGKIKITSGLTVGTTGDAALTIDSAHPTRPSATTINSGGNLILSGVGINGGDNIASQDRTMSLTVNGVAMSFSGQLLMNANGASRGNDPPRPVPRPDDVVEGWLEPETGLRVRPERRGAVPELFRRGALPPHRRLLRPDRPEPVVR
jgi:hypothetical protein